MSATCLRKVRCLNLLVQSAEPTDYRLLLVAPSLAAGWVVRKECSLGVRDMLDKPFRLLAQRREGSINSIYFDGKFTHVTIRIRISSFLRTVSKLGLF